MVFFFVVDGFSVDSRWLISQVSMDSQTIGYVPWTIKLWTMDHGLSNYRHIHR